MFRGDQLKKLFITSEGRFIGLTLSTSTASANVAETEEPQFSVLLENR